MKQRSNRGFTLIELMIVVAIMGTLLLIAIPTYDSYIAKSRRSEAKVALTGIAQLQETYYTKRNAYTAALTGANSVNCDQKGLCRSVGGNTLSVDGNYQLFVDNADNISFTLRAKAYSAAQIKDTKCNEFTLDEKNTKVSTPQPATECWR